MTKTVVLKAYITTEAIVRINVPDDMDDGDILEIADTLDGDDFIENPDIKTQDWENATIVYDDSPEYAALFGDPQEIDND